MSLLDPEDWAQLLPAETAAFAAPIPNQIVSGDELTPLPQPARQKQVEARVRELGGALARHQGIPEDMQRKHGFALLGPADGPVKRAIFGETSATLYKHDRRADLSTDRIARHRDAYEREGPGRTNRRYGFVAGSAGSRGGRA
jgi:hypothetical protein